MGKRSNGEGTIFKRKDGRWCAQYIQKIENKEVRKSVYGKTQKEVKEKLRLIREKETNGQIEPAAVQLSLEKWMKEWLSDYKQGTVKITTYQGYWRVFRDHIEKSEVAEIPVTALSTNMLQKYYNRLHEEGRSDKKGGLSPRMVRYVYVLINGALEQAVKNEILVKNVNHYVVLPSKEQKEITPMSETEVKRFLEKCEDERLKALYYLELFSGMRKGEISGLMWSDVDWERKQLYVSRTLEPVTDNEEVTELPKKAKLILVNPKTKRSKRIIPINNVVLKELEEHRNHQNKEKEIYADIYMDQNLIFCREDGNFIHPRFLTDNFHHILKKAGLPQYRFHDLRHTVASLLINGNENPKVVQELLGHASISTTLDIYGHLEEKTKRSSIEKLGTILQIS